MTVQCVILRQRVFHVCQTGISLLRRITKGLCLAYSLVEELDSPHCYLSFRPLEDLHQHMREEDGDLLLDGDGMGLEYEDSTSDDMLSLDSLKVRFCSTVTSHLSIV